MAARMILNLGHGMPVSYSDVGRGGEVLHLGPGMCPKSFRRAFILNPHML